MRAPVLVTGSSGNVGSAVVDALVARNIPVRATVRKVGRASRPGVEEVVFDFQDRSTFGPALEGCHGLFLMRPPPISNVEETLLPLIDQADRSGVQHIVFLSVVGADKNPVIPHHAVEKRLQAGPTAWTMLRAGFFSQNLCDAYAKDIQLGELMLPAGRGRAAFVDARDLGQVAAKALDEGILKREAPRLTGPEALSFDDVATILTQELGRPIHYRAVSPLRYALHAMRQGLPLAQATVQTILHVGLRFGQAEDVDPLLGTILGRAPTPLREVVRRHLDLWTPPGKRAAA